jgi:hypothetical protein
VGRLLEESSYAERAREVAAQMAGQHGTQRAAQLVRRFSGQRDDCPASVSSAVEALVGIQVFEAHSGETLDQYQVVFADRFQVHAVLERPVAMLGV